MAKLGYAKKGLLCCFWYYAAGLVFQRPRVGAGHRGSTPHSTNTVLFTGTVTNAGTRTSKGYTMDVSKFTAVILEYYQSRLDDVTADPTSYGLEADATSAQIEEYAKCCLAQDLIDHPEDFVADLSK